MDLQTLELITAELVKNDPALGRIINIDLVPTIIPHTDYFSALVRSIISQQLSVKAAATIHGRFQELFGKDSYPSPEDIVAISYDELRSVGLSRQKASYIKDLSEKVIDGTIDFSKINSLSNEEIIKELTSVKGIGVWTVHMYLIFCMGRLDVLPIGDLGVRNGIKKLYDLPAAPSPEDVTTLSRDNGWHPYESIVSWYMWRFLDNEPVV